MHVSHHGLFAVYVLSWVLKGETLRLGIINSYTSFCHPCLYLVCHHDYIVANRCFDLIWEIFSFTTERTSIGLNAALETACEKPDQAAAVEGLQESSHAFGIPEATVAPCLGSGFLKGLKYCDGSYTASLSPA
jgi:hypothetical protein